MQMSPGELRSCVRSRLFARASSRREIMRTLESRLIAATLLVCAVFASPALAGEIKGNVTASGMRSPEGIVVYIDTIAGKTFTPPKENAVMDQKHLMFLPHVLAILKGTAVDFLNSDSVGHNVYWPSVNGNKKLSHNMGTWPQGVKKSFTFNDLGAVPLLCNVHPEMAAYIFVTPTPYFAVTNAKGEYTIKDVPPGKYTLKTWSEQAKPFEQAVEVSGAEATVNLTVHK
jgi:plastocyanin